MQIVTSDDKIKIPGRTEIPVCTRVQGAQEGDTILVDGCDSSLETGIGVANTLGTVKGHIMTIRVMNLFEGEITVLKNKLIARATTVTDIITPLPNLAVTDHSRCFKSEWDRKFMPGVSKAEDDFD